MTNTNRFISATVRGGFLFLVPLTLLLLLVEKAVSFLRHLLRPVVDKLPYTHFAGLSILTLLSLVSILLLCFLAGLLMHTNLAKKMKTYIEDRILIYLPGYLYLKTVFSDKTNNDGSQWKPATILVDDNEVLCFVVDESTHFCSIFLPAAPNPSSGSVCVRVKREVRYLSLTMAQANSLIRQFGKGAATMLEKELDEEVACQWNGEIPDE